MAHAPSTAEGAAESTDVAERRHGWQSFLRTTKWLSLITLGGIFFLIFTLIGHAPFVPVALVMAVAVYLIGSIIH